MTPDQQHYALNSLSEHIHPILAEHYDFEAELWIAAYRPSLYFINKPTGNLRKDVNEMAEFLEKFGHNPADFSICIGMSAYLEKGDEQLWNFRLSNSLYANSFDVQKDFILQMGNNRFCFMWNMKRECVTIRNDTGGGKLWATIDNLKLDFQTSPQY